VRLSAIHAIDRCARVPDGVSSGRLGTGARASAGHRDGPSGQHIGNAPLQGACADAAGLCLRHPPAGPQPLARWAHTPGQGKALTSLAPHLARAVSDRLNRAPVFARDPGLPGSRAQRGCAGGLTGQTRDAPVSRTLQALLGCVSPGPWGQRPCRPAPWPVMGCPLWLWSLRRASSTGSVGGPSPAPGSHGRTGPVQPFWCRGRSEGPACFRGRRGPEMACAARALAGDRASRRVWCSHLGVPRGTAITSGQATDTSTPPGPWKAEKKQKTASRGSWSLDNGSPHKG